MNNIVIFGAGISGTWAFRYFGRNRVICFADNMKAGIQVCSKNVVSFQEMLEIYNNNSKSVIVIASENYWEEMEAQVRQEKLQRYFVFREADLCRMINVLPFYWVHQRPFYPTYAQILTHYDLSVYKRIAVYGVNRFLPYLLLELMDKNPYAEIRVISQSNNIVGHFALGIEMEHDWHDDMDALVINVKQNQDTIRESVCHIVGKDVDIIDLFDAEDFEPMFQHKELAVYKDLHKGKRIFVIGTGPSLRLDDLDTLHRNHEICIACNKIYRIYDKTLWRADYYGFLDGRVIEDCKEDISGIPNTVFLGDSYHYDINEYLENINYFHYKEEAYYPNCPRFSDDFTKGFYMGCTTTYSFGIQLAAYLGAAEIILLGVDFDIIGNVTNPKNHFIQDYFRENEAEKYKSAIFRREVILKAYEGAEAYSRKHGFRIYNATRGGSLEAFERVDFDALFEALN